MKKTLIAAGIAGALVIAGCGTNKESWEQVTVSSKERTCFNKDDCRYIVYTDKETFEITDQAFGRKNSSDVYGKIIPNKTYRFYVIGYRNPNQSKYRNIMEVNEVTTPTGTAVTIVK